jgi:phosphoribosyl 1,2-cyclic phosphodiesterase
MARIWRQRRERRVKRRAAAPKVMARSPREEHGVLQLRVNGIHSAWMAEFGHDCAHCDEIRNGDPYRIANVSYSLLQYGPDGQLRRHTLVDAGMGVMQSLLELERTRGVRVVHEVLLSHSHFDHVAHLDWLASAVRRNGRPDQPRPLPVHCTGPCWETGPGRLFPWLVDKAIVHRPIRPGESFRLGEVQVTPMEVEHGSTAPGAVGFAIELPSGGSAEPRKIILTCDVLRVTDRHDPAWFDADVCFIEANTWNPNPDTGHQCILDAIELIRLWRPRRAYLIHYSRHEDALHPQSEVSGPLAFDGLVSQVRRHLKAIGQSRLDIRIARHGMILPLDERWPA